MTGGSKMVSLAVSSGLQSLFPDDSRGEHLPLRTTEFWYPEVPPSSHYLYDDTFAGRNVSLYDYRPLVRVMFGWRGTGSPPQIPKPHISYSVQRRSRGNRLFLHR
ncbi:uncharacterized protein BDW43DRAFT_289181 [Aspergillus alliaceus]|uniref:uncharacterized protein n=1 Tax=Petromyces alliaceus TaxID=209559 RepID=UPI0012A3F702|nr:uncharacterized protein BDW43DRAFT_289181 [Aspergillus alliaceus]KAB8229069.1 hypothetical protein BDW43DRAFT_289181 [Aspergillus alliaceus]